MTHPNTSRRSLLTYTLMRLAGACFVVSTGLLGCDDAESNGIKRFGGRSKYGGPDPLDRNRAPEPKLDPLASAVASALGPVPASSSEGGKPIR